jgi:hypothetical protein
MEKRMNLLIPSVIGSVLISGCGVLNKPNSIDPTLQPYLDSFVAAGNIQGNLTPDGLTMQFGVMPTNTGETLDGYCEWGPLGNNTVTISQDYFSQYDETKRTLLVWHELGHCVLGRGHNNTINPVTGYPESIMYYESTASAVEYKLDPTPYVSELFQ